MVTISRLDPYKRYRFYLTIDGLIGDLIPSRIGLTFARQTVDGLELGRGHCEDKPTIFAFFAELPTDSEVTIVLLSRREGGPQREIRYRLGERRTHLAIDLDAMNDGIAFDRVLFHDATLLSVRDIPNGSPPNDV